MSINNKECLIVIGMHRCGTSAFAGCCSLIGYSVGLDPMPPTKENPKGYFENMSIFFLNERILSENNMRWDLVNPQDLNNIDQSINSKYISEIRQVIKDQYGEQEKIVIKDPRISLFPVLWKNALTQEGFNCSFIICYRDPSEVVLSLNKRDGFSFEKSAFLYAAYLEKAIRQTLIEKVNYVEYSNLLKSGGKLMLKLFPELILKNETLEEIDHFLSRDLNHFPAYSKVPDVAPKFLNSIYQLLIEGEFKKFAIATSKFFSYPTSYIDEDNNKLKEVNKLLESNLVETEQAKDSIEVKLHLKEHENQLVEQKVLSLEDKVRLAEDIVQLTEDKVQLTEDKLQSVEDKVHLVEDKLILTEDKLRLIEENELRLNNEIQELKDTNVLLSIDIDERMHYERELKDDILKLNQNENCLNQKIEVERQSIQNLEEHKINLEIRISLTEKTLKELDQSFSNRIGFAITFPLRMVYESAFFLNIKFLKLIPFLLRESIRNPKMVYRAMNPANISKLRYAISVENSKLTKNNVTNYFSDLKKIEEAEITHQDIIYNFDEVGKVGEVLVLRGWAISQDGIESVTIKDDNNKEVAISYGRKRADIAIVHPNYLDSLHSEFYFKSNWDKDYLTITIKSKSGERLEQVIEIKDLDDWSSLSLNEQYQLFLDRQKSSVVLENIDLAYKPLITIVVPVYNVDAIWLDKCVQSVLDQNYEYWELCLYDDCSSKQETLDSLRRWEYFDERIKVEFGRENRHIVHATNQAIKMSSGTYIGFLDNDDELTIDALFEVVLKLNENQNLKLIYSDEDKIEMDGRLVDPHFKSDFNLDMIRSNNYISHFSVVERNAGEKVKWLTPGMEGSQDHDFILKIIDLIDEEDIFHIPKVLYHWRKIPGSTAVEYSDKDYAFSAGRTAIANHLERNQVLGTIEKGLWPGSYRVRYSMLATPLVSIVIPFRDESDMLRVCLKSIKSKTSYLNYEIVLVDNGSQESATKDFLESLLDDKSIRQLKHNIPFNYSRINNWAVKQCEGDYILLLNNDIEVISRGWLTSMLELCQRDDVGAVGAKLLYDDNTIQHAGVFVGIGGIAGHAQKYLHNGSSGYFSRHQTIQNLSACTAACLLVKRSVYNEVRGLEEENLQIAFNDIDLCLRIRRAGYLIAYTPYAELFHYESKSRGQEDTPKKLKRFKKEISYFKKTWEPILSNGDPYYNLNLTLEREDFGLNVTKSQ